MELVAMVVLLLYSNRIIQAVQKDIPGLKYFETLTDVHFSPRTRRHIYNGKLSNQNNIYFKAFNRTFDIVLWPGTTILTDNFKATVIDGDGRSNRFYVDENRIFSGHFISDPDITVDGHMEDTMISLTIHDYQDMFALEPKRIYGDEDDKTWIIYRYSDTIWEGMGKGMGIKIESTVQNCGNNESASQDNNNELTDAEIFGNATEGRSKRRMRFNTCTFLAVGTYDLFVERCRKSMYTCANVLISSVLFADKVYSVTDFGSYTGLRLQIKEMMIYTSLTKSSSRYSHFNQAKAKWNYNTLLGSFTEAVKHHTRHFCISFLFNAHIVTEQVLGLAFIGTTCTKTNTGFATFMLPEKIPLTSIRGKVLFMHEAGHLFGSFHDPKTPECHKSSVDGGNFIMWPYIDTAVCKNCQKFSPCSRRSITRRFARPYTRGCFTDFTRREPFCGNGLVESGEQCDEGFHTASSGSCCDSKCRFYNGSTCSDQNKSCCSKCKIAKAGFMCRGHRFGSCQLDSFCDGKSLECPIPRDAEDGTLCKDHGKCFQGKCLDFCTVMAHETYKVFKPCLCDQDPVTGCRTCCYDINEGEKAKCLPLGNYTLANHRACYLGFCVDGVCTKNILQRKQNFLYLGWQDANEGLKFLKANIVATVVILSLLVWIPVSCFVSFLDNNFLQLYENRQKCIRQSRMHGSFWDEDDDFDDYHEEEQEEQEEDKDKDKVEKTESTQIAANHSNDSSMPSLVTSFTNAASNYLAPLTGRRESKV